MNIALPVSPINWSAISNLLRWPDPKSSANSPFAPVDVCPSESVTAKDDISVAKPNLQVHRPLRVVRWMEADQPPSQVGRMVISGRMADVCAELDRLIAREAAMH